MYKKLWEEYYMSHIMLIYSSMHLRYLRNIIQERILW